ncbi:MAG: hypothetical protein UU08_C0018G0014 [Candidatus Uhrbacteria bacterium GW2011_GWE2_40_58]|nr:MAG: hypothetical protein UT94_C0022G0010 [Candidatus Uhrbacteria bacterium GW2011_GWF2_40_263]KKR67405.1 MAG: hypothetical protein UU08_C0018G0014 [Candidatus Uhrbacteria bacterium GW2011_GWE2_40_58]OGL94385.1 MAG: hypothetical protein A2239_00390 [Candidatus Uhrbacteria bacterium RIFOXYA2_FULL_40_9]OGL98151.1 MAG: hypothetical protein A2332_02965 [Candidatus Uhrbacteria bacterium RIFOXYB2_FULL_41_18]
MVKWKYLLPSSSFMFDMITIGDIKLDTFVVLDDNKLQCELKMPECKLCLDYGAKIRVDVVDSQIAGSAPNVAVGLARMGKKTSIISYTGLDGTRELALKHLEKENVSTKFIQKVKGQQSSYSVVLNFKGEKTILTSHIKQIYRLPKKLAKPKGLYICETGEGYESLYHSIIVCSKKYPCMIGFNPGSVQIEERKSVLYKLLKQTTILFVNLEEAQKLLYETQLEIRHLITHLWKLGPKQVVITDGVNGSYGFDGKEIFHCPIFPAKLKEATGAGDAFATGYLGAILSGLSPNQALQWGSVNGASVVEYVGPQKGLLTTAQIKSRLKKNPRFLAKQL